MYKMFKYLFLSIQIFFCAITFLNAQPGKVTSASMEYTDGHYEDAIKYAKEAMAKPDLLSSKLTAKCNAVYAASLMQLYNKGLNDKDKIMPKVMAAYPNILKDAEDAIAVVDKLGMAADHKNHMNIAKRVLAIAFINKAQEKLAEDSKVSLELVDKSEALFKSMNANDPLLTYLSFMKGICKTSTNDDNIKKSAIGDFKNVISAFKTLDPKNKSNEAENIRTQFAPGSYAQLITLSQKYEPGSTKGLIDEAKKYFPDDKSINDASINSQIVSGNDEEVEKLLETEVQKDPKNVQKALLYAKKLEEKYERVKSANKPEAEQEIAYQNAIKAYSNVTTKFPDNETGLYNHGALLFNKSRDIAKKLNDLPPDAPDDQIKKLEDEKKHIVAEALPHFESVAKLQNYKDKVQLSVLISITAELGLSDKQKMYEQKKKELGN